MSLKKRRVKIKPEIQIMGFRGWSTEYEIRDLDGKIIGSGIYNGRNRTDLKILMERKGFDDYYIINEVGRKLKPEEITG